MLWLAARAYGFADWILFKFAALQLTRVQFSFPPRDKGVANRDSPKFGNLGWWEEGGCRAVRGGDSGTVNWVR
jgi:hypothetical protein